MDNWTLSFEARRGDRLHRYFWGICTYGENCWYSYEKKKWLSSIEGKSSTHIECRTLKAFIRHLRKHTELAGQEVILVNKYAGYDVIARPLASNHGN